MGTVSPDQIQVDPPAAPQLEPSTEAPSPSSPTTQPASGVASPSSPRDGTSASDLGASSPSSAVPSATPPPPRRSNRVRTRPKHLDIYFTPMIPGDDADPSRQASGAKYPLSDFVSYDDVSSTYHAFLVAVTSHDTPRTFL
ncbi:unnamed protein product [Linum trigynum]|uniref:Uncharacterized protein n=1 Tax=Linum trigynum TaxID=586398 RepID=A0AAV2E640_9ROSI